MAADFPVPPKVLDVEDRRPQRSEQGQKRAISTSKDLHPKPSVVGGGLYRVILCLLVLYMQYVYVFNTCICIYHI